MNVPTSFGSVTAEPDGDESPQSDPQGGRIDGGMEPGEHACLLQALEPFRAGRGSESDGSRQLFVRGPCILRQVGDHLAIGSVEQHHPAFLPKSLR
jgi:hypothetical protein